MRTKSHRCVLCKAKLCASEFPTLFVHPDTVEGGCQVRVTDGLGISADDAYELADGKIWGRAEQLTIAQTHILLPPNSESAFVSVETAAKHMFTAAGQPYLGGSSGDHGWSSVSTFQRCAYLWKHKYGGKVKERDELPGPPALEIGSLVHIFLAIHYSQRIDPKYPLDPEGAHRFFSLAPVTPAHLTEAWRLFQGYVIHWDDESWMTPLAVEELVVDPKTESSCRWDLVFRVDQPANGLLPGIYICDHKSAGDVGQITRDQWRNDGGILGQIDLFDKLHYEKRWGGGPFRGACINLLIKTKAPQYMRSWVYPPKAVLRDHRKSLQVWSAAMETAAATGSYPRSRAACITRYRGFCELFDHCSGAADSEREIEP